MLPPANTIENDLRTLVDLEARQEDVLKQLDDLNDRIERTLAEVQGNLRIESAARLR